MTYRQPPVCRRSGCGRLAVLPLAPAGEGDLGWCESHAAEVSAFRARVAGVRASRVRPEVFHEPREREVRA